MRGMVVKRFVWGDMEPESGLSSSLSCVGREGMVWGSMSSFVASASRAGNGSHCIMRPEVANEGSIGPNACDDDDAAVKSVSSKKLLKALLLVLLFAFVVSQAVLEEKLRSAALAFHGKLGS